MKNAASWAPSPAAVAGRRRRWPSSASSCPGPRTSTRAVLGPRRPHAGVRRRLRHPADPVGAGVPLGGHAVACRRCSRWSSPALWLTGGADSYMGPMLVLPMLYVAYFFPPRYAWPLAALEVATYASPLVTRRRRAPLLVHARSATPSPTPGCAHDPVPQAPPRRRRAPAAPDGARRSTHRARRTGARSTRRSTARSRRRALHAAARRRRLLQADQRPLRPHHRRPRAARAGRARLGRGPRGDCLARIGGDEFALVAPGAGSGPPRARGVAAAAGARVDAGDGPVSLTVVAAVYPERRRRPRRAPARARPRLHAIKDARRVQRCATLERDHAARARSRGARCRGGRPRRGSSSRGCASGGR